MLLQDAGFRGQHFHEQSFPSCSGLLTHYAWVRWGPNPWNWKLADGLCLYVHNSIPVSLETSIVVSWGYASLNCCFICAVNAAMCPAWLWKHFVTQRECDFLACVLVMALVLASESASSAFRRLCVCPMRSDCLQGQKSGCEPSCSLWPALSSIQWCSPNLDWVWEPTFVVFCFCVPPWWSNQIWHRNCRRKEEDIWYITYNI